MRNQIREADLPSDHHLVNQQTALITWKSGARSNTSATYSADGAAKITKKLRQYDSKERGLSFYSKKNLMDTTSGMKDDLSDIPFMFTKKIYSHYHTLSSTYVGLCYKVHISQNCDGLRTQ